MYQIGLSVRKENDFFFSIQPTLYRFHMYEFRSVMYLDLLQDDEYIYAGKKVLINQWLIPPVVSVEGGNLRFEAYKADGDSYVWWEDLNKKFRLVGYDASEMKELTDR